MNIPEDFVGADDELLIEATGEDVSPRTWTRTRLSSAKAIADMATQILGYDKAQVFDVFGGCKSDTLYTVTRKGNP
jgi:hypothetical protein